MISHLRDISLRTKITASFVLIVILGTAISTFLGSKIITRAMLNEALKQLRHGLKAADMVYAARLDTVRKSVAGAAETEQLAIALRTREGDNLPQVLARIRDNNGLHFLTFVETGDRGIVRASRPQIAPPEGVPAPLAEYINNASAGKITAGTELFGHEALIREDPALEERARIKVSQLGDNAAPGETIDKAMVLVAAAPVRAGSGLVGVLYGGILLIIEFVFGAKEYDSSAGGTVSIFMDNVQIATSGQGASGHEVGIRTTREIQQAVLSQGNRYYSRGNVAGTWHMTAYEPIRDHSGRIVGPP